MINRCRKPLSPLALATVRARIEQDPEGNDGKSAAQTFHACCFTADASAWNIIFGRLRAFKRRKHDGRECRNLTDTRTHSCYRSGFRLILLKPDDRIRPAFDVDGIDKADAL